MYLQRLLVYTSLLFHFQVSDSSRFYIRSRQLPQYCLNFNGVTAYLGKCGGDDDTNRMITAENRDSFENQWQFKLNQYSNQCLHVNRYEDWTRVAFTSCPNALDWISTSSGEIKISASDSQCLENFGLTYPMISYLKECDGRSAQQWDFVPEDYTFPTTSPLPASLSPSSSALVACDSATTDKIEVSISITTDDYPHENSWAIRRVNKDGPIVDSSEPFTSGGTTYEKELCLDSSFCYLFTIYDKAYDGIYLNGAFSVIVDEQVVLSDESDTLLKELDVSFGACTTPSPTVQPTSEPLTDLSVAKVASRRLGLCVDYYSNAAFLVECSPSGTDLTLERIGNSNKWQVRLPDVSYSGNTYHVCFVAYPLSGGNILFDSALCNTEEENQQFVYTSSGKIRSLLYPSFCVHDNEFPYPITYLAKCDEPQGVSWDLIPVDAMYTDFSSSPTPAPVPTLPMVPTSAPVPPSSSSCDHIPEDSPLRFRTRNPSDNKLIWRSCKWVAAKSTVWRCTWESVSTHCQKTCSCDISNPCIDSMARFRLTFKGQKMARSCPWVQNKQTSQRCDASGVKETCPVTCGSCPSP